MTYFLHAYSSCLSRILYLIISVAKYTTLMLAFLPILYPFLINLSSFRSAAFHGRVYNAEKKNFDLNICMEDTKFKNTPHFLNKRNNYHRWVPM